MSDLTSKPYLFDSAGRVLIARATTDTGRGYPPTLHLPAIPKAIRAFHKTAGVGSDVAKAREIQRSVQLKIANVGVGVSRGGCIFMNDKRRERVRVKRVWEVVPVEG